VHSKEDSNGSSLDNNFTILEIAIFVFRSNLIWTQFVVIMKQEPKI
jgi:hypothetical protein